VSWRITLLIVVSVWTSGALAQVIEDIYVTTTLGEQQPWSDFAGAADSLLVTEQLPGLRMDVAEIFAGLPGIQADSRSNFAQDTRLTVRGFGARSAFGVRGIDIRLDDIPLTMPDGQSQTSMLMTDTLGAVEVLRGPLAVLYGNGAGGVLALHPTLPQQRAVTLGLGGGADDQRRYRLRGEWVGGDHAARLQVSKFTTEGFRAHSEATREQLGLEWFYQPGQWDIRARLDISRDPDSADPQGLTPDQWREDPTQVHSAAERFDTRKSVDHRQVSVRARRNIESGHWQLAAWAGERDIEQKLAFPGSDITSGGGVVVLDKTFAGTQAQMTHEFGALALTLGTELEQMRDRRRGYVNDFGQRGEQRRDETGDVESLDVFTGLLWSLSESWQLQAGARYQRLQMQVEDYFIQPDNPDDSGELSYREPTYALGINYGQGPWHWFASVGRGFETPTLTELAYRPEGTGLNPLDAADNRQFETGGRWQSERFTASLALYTIETHKELVVDTSAGGRTTYRNAAETRRQGVEWMSLWQPLEQWRWRVGGTWLDARYRSGPFADNRLPGVAKTNLYSQWEWSPLGTEKLQVELTAHYRSRMPTGDDNTDFAPASTLWDLALRSQQRWGSTQFHWWVKLVNVTDRQAVGAVIVNQSGGRVFEPLPGRGWQLGLEWQLPW